MTKLLFLLPVLLLLSLSSCHLREKMVYLQPNFNDSLVKASPILNYAPILRTDDLLQIQVGGQDQEALANFQFFVSNSLNNNAIGAQAGIQATQSSSAITYLVDPNGNINFPVLGFVKVAGLTRLEATLKLQSMLEEYVAGAVVNIQVKNFKVTVLGQVARPGAYTMPSDRVTILEAIGMAGDLQLGGIRNNVLVVRELDGKRQEFRLDLTSKDIYSSEAYYLRQNDVIYVEPNKGARFQGQNIQVFTQVVTPVLSILLSVYTLFAIN
jgi:polysaccharide export outer membrane protein